MIKKIDKLGLLIEKELITIDDVELIENEVKSKSITIDEALLGFGLIEEENMARIYAEALNVPYMDLRDYAIDINIVKIIPEDIALKYKIIPLFKIDEILTIAMVDPLDISAIDKIYNETNLLVEIVAASENSIMKAIDKYYQKIDSLTSVVDDLSIGLNQDEIISEDREASAIDDVPVVKAVNLIILQAIKDRASDIHIEPNQNVLCIRYRIDGVLRETLQLPARLASVVVSRIKVLAGINIAEKRIAQDGHIEFNYKDEQIDLRVATYPVTLGEKVVLRLLRKSSVMLGLEQLGFMPDTLEKFNSLIARPYGIILTTGPTGSGKTTTLYATLQKLNTSDKNIITIEDPVEYQINHLNQSQINPKAGWTFEAGLRAMLRLDPNIIMVGEIRDTETANIAIQAALTGHLVLSSLHTNDASSAITRLIDMGVEPFLISAGLIGVIAQRLVRLLCNDCKVNYKPKSDILNSLNINEDVVFYREKGCNNCNNTGYKGRIGIFELMILNDEIRSLAIAKTPPGIIKKSAEKAGMRNLRQTGLSLVLNGKTSFEEIIRVTQDVAV